MRNESLDQQRRIFDKAKIPEIWMKDVGDRMIITTALELSRRGSDPQHRELAQNVLEVYRRRPEQPPEDELLEKCRKHADPAMTAEMTAALAWDNPNGVLAKHRSRLGYMQPGDEVPFRVVVPMLPGYPERRQGWRSEKNDSGRFPVFESRDVWKDLTNTESYSVFTDQLHDSYQPTIVVPPHEADYLLRPLPDGQSDWEGLVHEYYHTQRTFMYAAGDLHHFLDEVGVDHEVKHSGYKDELAVLRLLTETTTDLDVERDCLKPFFAGDAQGKARFLQQLKENFGAVGQLLLGVAPIRGNYQPDFALPLTAAPGLMNESTRLLETLLELRQRRDPAWLKTLEQHMRGYQRATLEARFKYRLRPHYLKMDPTEANDTRVGQVQALFERISKDKAEAGEQGFEDQFKQ